ncbi:glycosyltransferase family 2 protein [Gluconacetobacter azotocaptans]|uniref:Glycosyltransferase family 2 protein n=1 Tax=Gluconacetobacter azotocaptans TaxID=142834 RepID=A0A7W4JW07_9PROT|nr:glycosyltransferase family 2 protein [Gluconacetobacter azotocaptans]MBB2191920.1 glycosyltransferase family 2 protein [Gluconacetobacter azotocaptans]MBM9403612.1 glycosyltransferase family 2 protein [Gluconacetobacter azotocaptans]GBQ28279.1 glycosyltransferase [Gluconacetobacter azotocaptans DSM 13594]
MFERTTPRNIACDILFEAGATPTPPRDTITVAVSLYNYAAFIAECLSSIAAQTHQAIDLVVVDDHSTTDASVAVATDWMKTHHHRFARTTLLRHRRNQGLAETRNTAILHARTDPVFVMDADNQIYPRALARLYEFVAHRDYDAAYTQLELFGEARRPGYADVWDKDIFRHGNHVDAMALVSRASWAEVGGYTHLQGGWEDYDFWCKFIEAGMTGAYVPEMLCRYRVHGTSMMRTESTASEEQIRMQMIMRHPWLRI